MVYVLKFVNWRFYKKKNSCGFSSQVGEVLKLEALNMELQVEAAHYTIIGINAILATVIITCEKSVSF